MCITVIHIIYIYIHTHICVYIYTLYTFHYLFHYNHFLMCEFPLYAVNKESASGQAGQNKDRWRKLDKMLREIRQSQGNVMYLLLGTEMPESCW